MSYRTLLVHAEANPARVARLHCAASLADRFGAHVVGVGAETLPPFDQGMEGAYAIVEGSWAGAVRDELAASLLAAEENFRRAMGSRSHEWRARLAPPTRVMAETARTADLLIVGGLERSVVTDDMRSVNAARLVLTAGRPVLHCPAVDTQLSTRSILVAWKDSREARRAVADALPILGAAQSVTIVEICSENEVGRAAVETADVVHWLARHGVKAKAEPTVRDGAHGEVLLELAHEMQAELIVAGAYGHSRLGEWAFGGVTETLLHQDRVFVLLSH